MPIRAYCPRIYTSCTLKYTKQVSKRSLAGYSTFLRIEPCHYASIRFCLSGDVLKISAKKGIETKMIFEIFIVTAIISETAMGFPQSINFDDYDETFLCSTEEKSGYR